MAGTVNPIAKTRKWAVSTQPPSSISSDHDRDEFSDTSTDLLEYNQIAATSPSVAAMHELIKDSGSDQFIELKPSTFDETVKWLTNWSTGVPGRVFGLRCFHRVTLVDNKFKERLRDIQIKVFWFDDLERLLKELGHVQRQNIRSLSFDWYNIYSPGSVKEPENKADNKDAKVFRLLADCGNLKKLEIRIDPYRLSHCPRISNVPTHFYYKLPQPRDLFQMRAVRALREVRLGPDAEITLKYEQATRPPKSWIPPAGFLSGLEAGMLRPKSRNSNQTPSNSTSHARAKRARARWERWLKEERQRWEWVQKAGREINPELMR
jgi:hypothetical protein